METAIWILSLFLSLSAGAVALKRALGDENRAGWFVLTAAAGFNAVPGALHLLGWSDTAAVGVLSPVASALTASALLVGFVGARLRFPPWGLSSTNEIQYQVLFENAPLGIGLVDAKDGMPIAFNNAMLAPGGYSRKDIAGIKSVAELYYRADDRNRVLEKFRRDNKLIGEEVEFRARSGEPYCVSLSMVPIRLAERTCTLAMAEDISARKTAEGALKTSERQFRALFEGAGIGMALVSLDGKILQSNEALNQFLGYSTEELIGVDVSEVSHPEDHNVDLALKKEMARENVTVGGMDKRYIRKDGLHVWGHLTISFVVDEGGKPQYVVGMVEDISERKKAETALKEKLAQEEMILDNVDAIVWMVGTHDEYTLSAPMQFLSPKIKQVLGYEPEEFMVDQNLWFSIVHPEDKEAVAGLTIQVLATRSSQIGHYRVKHKQSGEYRWIEDRVKAQLDEEGNTIGMIGVARDVTDRHRYEAELELSREQLRLLAARLQQVREEERTMMSREIHDELGQALTGMKMDISWLSECLPPDQEDALERGRAVMELMDKTLDVVRGLSTRLRPALLDDLGLVAAVEWQTGEFRRRTGLNVVLECNVDEIHLEGARATALFRILQESLTNVVRHSQATRVEIHLSEDQGVVILKVIDDGVGIRDVDLISPQSIGLLGIRERAAVLGGKVSFDPGQDLGTEVVAQIPLRSTQASRFEGQPA